MNLPPLPEGYRFADEPPLREVNRGRPTENRALAGFTPVVTEQGRKRHPVDQIDPRLYEIMALAAKDSPYEVRFDSGFRQGDKRQHGKHNALDVELWKDGKKLSDYQNPKHFREYEQFAQSARRIQQQLYPELDNAFRWGGYFSGKKNYGALDLMHFDVGGGKGLGMLGGSWDGGLTNKQRSLWKGIQSEGMAGVRQAAGPMGPPITQLRRDMQQYFPPLPEGYRFADETPAPAPATPSTPSKSGEKYYGYYTPRGINSGLLVDPKFLSHVASVEQKHGIPTGTLQAIMAKESNGNPDAVSPADKQGLHGWGIGQFRNATARGLAKQSGIPIWQNNKVNMDPYTQAQAMGELLSRKRKSVGGNWDEAVWAYNAGEKNVLDYKRSGKYSQFADKVDPRYMKEVVANRDAINKGRVASPSTPTTIASAALPPLPPGYRFAD